jgi:small subunit ribosomal protein S8
MYTDPIADFLTRVRNAVRANHKVVEIPASNHEERNHEDLI